jgi:serine protease Do
MRLTVPTRIARRAGRVLAAALGLALCMLWAPLLVPAHAAAPAGDQLRRAGQIASPSIVLIKFTAQAYLNDNRDGSIHGPYSFGYLGTGFFVSSDGYVATASHLAALTNEQIKNQMADMYVLEAAQQNGCVARGDCDALVASHQQGYEIASSVSELQTHLSVFTQNMNAASQDTVGIPAQLKASSPFGQSDVAVIKINGENEPVLPLGNAGGVQAQDPISVIGYPGISNTSTQTLLVPTITTGTITALKQGSADLGLAPGVSIFQTDATVEHGNSGGPAINERGQVVGVVSFGAASTTNFLISVKELQDQVRQSGASTGSGQIDQLWRQGLGYFDQHRYVKARAAFDQCTALNKVQVGCTQFSQKAAGLLSQDEESKYAATLPVGLIAGAAGGLLLVVLLALVVVLVMRRRGGSASPPQPEQPAVYPTTPLATVPAAAGPVAVPPVATPPAAVDRNSDSPSSKVGFVPPQPAASQQSRFCSNCGSPLTPGQAACSRCGR